MHFASHRASIRWYWVSHRFWGKWKTRCARRMLPADSAHICIKCSSARSRSRKKCAAPRKSAPIACRWRPRRCGCRNAFSIRWPSNTCCSSAPVKWSNSAPPISPHRIRRRSPLPTARWSAANCSRIVSAGARFASQTCRTNWQNSTSSCHAPRPRCRSSAWAWSNGQSRRAATSQCSWSIWQYRAISKPKSAVWTTCSFTRSTIWAQ